MKRRVVVVVSLWLGCATWGQRDDAPVQPPSAGARAREAAKPIEVPVAAEVRIDPVAGAAVSGSGRFAVDRGVVTLDLVVSNVPEGAHAVALQDACDGAHWNPTHARHGRFDATPFHLGDVGNFFANAQGHGSITFSTELWSVGTGLSNDVVDRYVVVREGRDDFTSQPDGNAGRVLGCGRVELSQLTQPAVSMTGRLIETQR